MNTTDEVLEQLERVVDVKRLIAKLSFDLDSFEQANLEQPRLYLEAGRYLTWAVFEKSRSELRLETMEAELGLRLRESQTKRTEKAIAERITVDEQIKKQRRKAYMAKVSEVWAKQLSEAYQQRLQVLGNITKIRTGEMATELRSAKERAAVDVVRKQADKLRRNIE